MPRLLALVFLAAYALLIIGSLHVYRLTKTTLDAIDDNPRCVWLAHNLFAIGVPPAVAMNLIPIPLSPDARYFGVPAPYLGFERHNGRWIDFVSPLSFVIGAANLLAGPGLAALAVQVWLRASRLTPSDERPFR